MTPEQTNAALAFITLLLAGATVWLAIATWRMATVSKAAFLLETRPYFAFKTISLKLYVNAPAEPAIPVQTCSVRVGLVFRNPGRVMIQYKVTSIHVTFSGQTLDVPEFETMGGVIYPDDESTFYYATIPNVALAPMPKVGVVEYEVEYNAVKAKEVFKSAWTKLRYTLHSLESPSVDFVYLEEADS